MGMFENALLYVFFSFAPRFSVKQMQLHNFAQGIQIFFELLHCRVCGLELVEQSQTYLILHNTQLLMHIYF